MFKVGILGYGKMGKVYAECFTKNPNTCLVSVYNHTGKRKQELAQSYPQVRYYTDWRALVEDPKVQIVGICTSTDERFEQMKFCMEHRKHIICEKAMCLDVDQALKLLEIAEKSDRCIRIASELEFHPVIKAVNDHLARIGRVVYAEMELSMFREEIKWKHRMNAGGGVLRELGQHFLDVASLWFGTPKSITGFNKIVLPQREVEDISVNMIQYENGTLLLLKNNYFEHKRNTYWGSLYGEKGQIDFELSSYDTTVRKVVIYENPDQCETISVELPDQGNKIYPGHMDSFHREINRFVDDIISGTFNTDSIIRECGCIGTVCGSYLSAGEKSVSLPVGHFSHLELPNLLKKDGIVPTGL